MNSLCFSKLGNNADQYEVCEEGTGRTVAVTHDDEGGRNAAIFAAAMDLYEACKRGLHWADCQDMRTADEHVREDIAFIRAALAKATA